MREGAAFRGQPLLLLMVLLVGWLALRTVLWQPPFGHVEQARFVAAPRSAASGVMPTQRTEASAGALAQVSPRLLAEQGTLVEANEPIVPVALAPAMWSDPLVSVEPAPAPVVETPRPGVPTRAVVGHNLLLAAGLAHMEVPAALLAYLQVRTPPPGIPAAVPMLAAVPPRTVADGSRWSGDVWLLLRRDSTTPLLAGRPSYGRSQAGAVIRYRLAPASPLRPQAYVRASAALAGAREQEVAAGLSSRVLPALPLRFAVEARAGQTDFGTRLRPAAFVVTEFPPVKLPLGMRAEAYAQGGYVGGDYATAFADGQARVERPLARSGATEISAGAGAWGGAQKGAARLDIGPTAAVSFRLGPKSFGARGRVAADYRFRVAGDAEPSSGPALTLSAGF